MVIQMPIEHVPAGCKVLCPRITTGCAYTKPAELDPRTRCYALSVEGSSNAYQIAPGTIVYVRTKDIEAHVAGWLLDAYREK